MRGHASLLAHAHSLPHGDDSGVRRSRSAGDRAGGEEAPNVSAATRRSPATSLLSSRCRSSSSRQRSRVRIEGSTQGAFPLWETSNPEPVDAPPD